jgi:multiple sugar transport system permease protein
MVRSRAERIRQAATTHGLLLLLMCFTAAPIVWGLSTSFKSSGDMFAVPPQWIPTRPTLGPYLALFASDNPFTTWYRNSLFVAIATGGVCLLFATGAGYALSRYPFRGSDWILLLIVGSQMFPLVMLLIPIYLLFRDWGLLNSLPGLVLAYMSFALPFSIWMLKNYFDTVPRELEEAAAIDGSSRLGTLVRVVLPVVSPGLISVGIFGMLVAWNELMFALTLVTRDAVRTTSAGLVIRYAGQYQSAQNELMAASVLVSVPVVLLFVLLQRYVVAGLTAGSVKG